MKKGSFKRKGYMNRGDVDCQGYVSKYFGLYKSDCWVIIHLPTKEAIYTIRPTPLNFKEGKVYVSWLESNKTIDWSKCENVLTEESALTLRQKMNAFEQTELTGI